MLFEVDIQSRYKNQKSYNFPHHSRLSYFSKHKYLEICLSVYINRFGSRILQFRGKLNRAKIVPSHFVMLQCNATQKHCKIIYRDTEWRWPVKRKICSTLLLAVTASRILDTTLSLRIAWILMNSFERFTRRRMNRKLHALSQ